VRDGRAESIPLRDGEVDAVAVGEAFHWLRPRRPRPRSRAHRARRTQTLDPAGFLAQVASWSWIANLDGEPRRELLHDVAGLVRGQAQIVIPYRTDLYLARRAERPRARFA
jgi:hypothetical protein